VSLQLGSPFSELPLTAPALEVGSLVMINSITAVPEPSALMMVGCAILGLATRRERRLATI
jgi:hypothetical protein